MNFPPSVVNRKSRGRLCKPSSVPAAPQRYCASEQAGGDHFYRPAVADWLSRPAAPLRVGVREATYPPAERPKPPMPGPSTALGPKREMMHLGNPFADRLLGLAGGGVFPAGDVAAAAVRSYRTFSPLPEPREAIGCVFSVALSLGFPTPLGGKPHRGSRSPVAVSHHRALSCSDFPPGAFATGDRPSRPGNLRFTI